MSLRDQILAASSEKVAVPIPDWGVTVFVRRLALQEALDLLAGEKSPARRTAELVALAAVDEGGAPVFEPADAERLATGPFGSALLRISAAAMKLNGLDEEAPGRLGKGSKATPGVDSPSSSPAS
ncbi:MAG: hypothetical protein U0800_26020 [Isosphaeraceae bacterium]